MTVTAIGDGWFMSPAKRMKINIHESWAHRFLYHLRIRRPKNQNFTPQEFNYRLNRFCLYHRLDFAHMLFKMQTKNLIIYESNNVKINEEVLSNVKEKEIKKEIIRNNRR